MKIVPMNSIEAGQRPSYCDGRAMAVTWFTGGTCAAPMVLVSSAAVRTDANTHRFITSLLKPRRKTTQNSGAAAGREGNVCRCRGAGLGTYWIHARLCAIVSNPPHCSQGMPRVSLGPLQF